MAQCLLPFKYAPEFKESGMTSLAGLPSYLELGHVLGLTESIERNVKTREGGQGYSDRQMVMSLVLLNLAGGDCVDDLSRIEEDSGFTRILRHVETHGMPRRERRAGNAVPRSDAGAKSGVGVCHHRVRCSGISKASASRRRKRSEVMGRPLSRL